MPARWTVKQSHRRLDIHAGLDSLSQAADGVEAFEFMA